MTIISKGGFSVGVTDYTFEVQTENDGWMKIVTYSCKSGAISIAYVRAEEFLAFLLGKAKG